MNTSPVPISHNRLVELKPIEQHHEQFINDAQTRYFVYEVDDNLWQNVNPDGETDYELQSIKQDPARIPVGILTIEDQKSGFSFEGDLTIDEEDQKLIFKSLT